MRSMPFDSKITGYDESGIPLYDRASSAEEFARLLSAFLTSGIWGEGMFAVTTLAGMQVSVSEGECMIGGRFGFAEVPETLTFTASAQYPKIDTVVLRLDISEEARSISLGIHAGTPAQAPKRPALTRTGTVWELGLADILIPAGSTAIAQSRITDTRLDGARCGLVAAINSRIDTSALYAQIQSDLAGFKAGQEADFSAWFANIRDQLSEDAAGNLQMQVDGKQDKITPANAETVRQTLGAGTVSSVNGKEPMSGNVQLSATDVISAEDAAAVRAVLELGSGALREVQRGLAAVAVTENATASVTVTFPVPFSAVPTVVATLASPSPADRSVGVYNITASGANLYIANGTTYTGNMNVRWVAVL